MVVRILAALAALSHGALAESEALSEEQIRSALREGFQTAALGLPPWGRSSPQEAADAARMQALFRRAQHPPSCSAARFLVSEAHPYGFGSQLSGLAGALLEATALGMVWVAEPMAAAVGATRDSRGRLGAQRRTEFISRRRCPSMSWDCVFLPFSGCSVRDVPAAHRARPECRCKHVPQARGCPAADCAHITRTSFEPWGGLSTLSVGGRDLSEELSKRAGLSKPRGVLFFVAEALRWITRPSGDTAALTRRLVQDLTLPADLSTVVGAHIRHGRSSTETGLAAGRTYWDVDAHASAVQAVAAGVDGAEHCLFGTDDPQVERAFPPALRRRGGRPGLPQLSAHTISAERWRAARSGDGADDAMLLAAQLYMLGGCGAFVGSFEMNTAKLAVPMMAAVSPGRPPPPYLDMGGSAWHFGEPWVPRGHPSWTAPFHGLKHHERRRR